VAVGAIRRGVLEPASRAEIREYAETLVNNELAVITKKLEDAQQSVLDELQLGIREPDAESV